MDVAIEKFGKVGEQFDYKSDALFGEYDPINEEIQEHQMMEEAAEPDDDFDDVEILMPEYPKGSS